MNQKARALGKPKEAKWQVAAEGRSPKTGASSSTEREEAYQLFCNRPFKLTPKQFRQVLEEDAWGV
jgi:hypothetical protein